jgi:hypothetical protein
MHLRPLEKLAPLDHTAKASRIGEVILTPVCSPARDARVVYEMDRRMPESFSSSILTSVVLPAPEGAVTM